MKRLPAGGPILVPSLRDANAPQGRRRTGEIGCWFCYRAQKEIRFG